MQNAGRRMKDMKGGTILKIVAVAASVVMISLLIFLIRLGF